MNEIIVIDIEASSLGPDSYPIEIAWLNTTTGQSDSFLINPESAEQWHDWDTFAEATHGIPRDQAVAEGIDVMDACLRLNRALRGKTLYSDAEADQGWLARLFHEVLFDPEFELRTLDRLIPADTRETFAQAAEEAPRGHRALADCRTLAMLLDRFSIPR